tara:strand:- start:214 stop:372 length:159 start_codon:yes stop_codon:yes gene_type:complete
MTWIDFEAVAEGVAEVVDEVTERSQNKWWAVPLRAIYYIVPISVLVAFYLWY